MRAAVVVKHGSCGVCRAGSYLLISVTDEAESLDETHASHAADIYVLNAANGQYLTTLVLGGNKSHVGGRCEHRGRAAGRMRQNSE